MNDIDRMREALDWIANLAEVRQADTAATASAMAGNAFRKIAKKARTAAKVPA